MIELITKLLLAIALHCALGCLFAVGFHWRGLARLDPASQGAGIGFRAIITPGVIALWPLLAIRWWRAERGGLTGGQEPDRTSAGRLRFTHALAWKILVATIPLWVGAALWLRPTPAADPTIDTRFPHSGTVPALKPGR